VKAGFSLMSYYSSRGGGVTDRDPQQAGNHGQIGPWSMRRGGTVFENRTFRQGVS